MYPATQKREHNKTMDVKDVKPENTIPLTLYVERVDVHPKLDLRRKKHAIDIEITNEDMQIIVNEFISRSETPGTMRVRFYGRLVIS